MTTLLSYVMIALAVLGGAYFTDFLGLRTRCLIRSFADAAGLTTTVSDSLQWATVKNLGTTKKYPRVRRVVHHPESMEFILYPALGKSLADYQDKAEALAQCLHAAQATITPLGVGDRALVVVYYSDPIPPKFRIEDFIMGDMGRSGS